MSQLFEVRTPDGRLIRTPASSASALKENMMAGYELAGRVIGASSDGKGGLVEPVAGPSLMKTLLDAHGDELVAWLRARGGP